MAGNLDNVENQYYIESLGRAFIQVYPGLVNLDLWLILGLILIHSKY
jgi:hypothetical protein